MTSNRQRTAILRTFNLTCKLSIIKRFKTPLVTQVNNSFLEVFKHYFRHVFKVK